MNKVSTYLNVYSKHDSWQTSGVFDVDGWIAGGPFALIYAKLFSDRKDKCAINIGIDRMPGFGSKVGHSDLHTAPIWREMLAWLGRANLSINQPGVNGSLNKGGGCSTGPSFGGIDIGPYDSTKDGSGGRR